jgi:hypothetical protein
VFGIEIWEHLVFRRLSQGDDLEMEISVRRPDSSNEIGGLSDLNGSQCREGMQFELLRRQYGGRRGDEFGRHCVPVYDVQSLRKVQLAKTKAGSRIGKNRVTGEGGFMRAVQSQRAMAPVGWARRGWRSYREGPASLVGSGTIIVASSSTDGWRA